MRSKKLARRRDMATKFRQKSLNFVLSLKNVTYAMQYRYEQKRMALKVLEIFK